VFIQSFHSKGNKDCSERRADGKEQEDERKEKDVTGKQEGQVFFC
jgi:hypothetical protein